MGRRPIKSDGEPWDRITERWRGARVRFKPEVVPELMAWLMMFGRRFELANDALKPANLEHLDEQTASLNLYYAHAINLIQMLLNTLNDKWSAHEWAGKVAEVQKMIDRAGGGPKFDAGTTNNQP